MKACILGVFFEKDMRIKSSHSLQKTTILVHLPADDNLSSQGTVRQIAQWNSNLLLAV